MAEITVRGGHSLNGSVTVQGSKNLALPVLCAGLLIDGSVVLHNCPRLSDTEDAVTLLQELGAAVIWDGNTLRLDNRNVAPVPLCGENAKKSRVSVLLLGAMLGRFGEGCVAYPGGCNIGARPIDLHLAALRALGAEITEDEACLCARAEKRKGNAIRLSFPSVGATENAILLAVSAKGTTVIRGAATEPEVAGLCEFLQLAGADIRIPRAGEIVICGGHRLCDTEYTLFGDRIVAGTYLACTALTGGRCELRGAPVEHMHSVLTFFAKTGCSFVQTKDTLVMHAPLVLQGEQALVTDSYPGFPTDMQPLAAAVLAKACGDSVISEQMFEHRFGAAESLTSFGAGVAIEPPNIYLHGGAKWHGARVTAGDLRGAAALVAAALAAEGESHIAGAAYLYRGYEDLIENLRALGADLSVEE